MEMIRVADMLKQMLMKTSDGEFIPFRITFVKCDLKRNTGGQKVSLASSVLEGGPSSKDKPRNPNHHRNYTRNIRAAEGDRIMKIHVLLVTQFNGAKVIL
jgi:hypothetical protein